MQKEKLRIGLLIDDFIVPHWLYLMIEKINDLDCASIVVIIKNTMPASRVSFFERLRKSHRHIAYGVYRRIEDRLFRQSHSAFGEKDMHQLVDGVPVLEVTPVQTKFSDTIARDDIEKIKHYTPDVLIRMGFRILRGEILTAARHGIWSYHHGDNRVNRGGPACVWELLEGWRETGSILQILTGDLDAGKVLYRSWAYRDAISLNRTINSLYWKSVSFMPRKLKELYELGSEAFETKIKRENEGIHFYAGPLYTTPRNFHFLKLVTSRYIKRIRFKLWELFNFEQWILLYAFHRKGILTSLFRYKRMYPPKDRFWADPCVIFTNDRYYIFIEELIYKERNGKAHIAVIEMDERGNYHPPQIVLQKDYHLSYPYVFQYGDMFYMIPETSEHATIELYRCLSFPDKWEFVMNLMENIKAVDTTIFQKDGKVWMFTNIIENQGGSGLEELFLFCADDLLTQDWQPHPQNPVVSDVKSSRPAGALFYQGDKLFRPSQDCSYRYGYATVINEVTELNTNTYKEKVVSHILPKWAGDVIATHTLSHQKHLTVVDSMIRRKR